MTALQALARAADAPTDTPPCGEPCPEPVAGVKPATPPAVDVNEWGPAIGERYIGAVEYAVQEANKRGDGFEYRTGENALMERRKLPAVTQASAATQTAPAAPTAPVATSTPGTPPAVSSEFERVGKVRVDLAAMVAQGAKPESLIGLGVYYKGNMANPSGSGAITGTGKSDFYGLIVDVTLESGMVWRAIRSSEFKEGSFYLDAKMHGAPYMAELAAKVAAIKANASASKEIAATAHAKAMIDLAAQYPQLKRAENTYAGGKLAAVNIRILLKEAFKGCKFSVTSDYSKVSINWTDGPSDKQVNEIVGRFDIGASDSQSDYFYTVSTAFSQLFGGVQYLFTRREVSDSLVQVAIDRLYADRSEKPTVTDYRKCTGIFDWNSQNYENRRVREMLETFGK